SSLREELRRSRAAQAEARAQLAATAEILRLMSRSAGQLQPVLDGIARSAARLCEADDVMLLLREGDLVKFAAHHGSIPFPSAVGETAYPLSRKTVGGSAIL